MPDDNERMIKPTMHHVNLKTNRLNEMIDWYASVIGTKVNFQFPGGAFISNDRANHRIALLVGCRRLADWSAWRAAASPAPGPNRPCAQGLKARTSS
jgi:catechol 2,3-dioxygenase-like lactoylglutathione lyase family enzyme